MSKGRAAVGGPTCACKAEYGGVLAGGFVDVGRAFRMAVCLLTKRGRCDAPSGDKINGGQHATNHVCGVPRDLILLFIALASCIVRP